MGTLCSTRIIPITAYTKRRRPTLHARCKAGRFSYGPTLMLRRPSEGKTLRVQSSDDRPRAKPSGFTAPTTVQGQNPQGSELRRPSKGKTLRVQGSDDRPRAKPSGFTAPTTVRGPNPQGSELRRPSEGKTLRVRSSDDRPRAKPSGFRAPTTVQGLNPQGYFPYDRWGLMYQKGLPDMLAAAVGMIELDIEDIDARREACTVPADLSFGG